MSLIYEALQKARREKDAARAAAEGQPTPLPDDVNNLTSLRLPESSSRESAGHGKTKILLPVLVMGTLVCLSMAMMVFALYMLYANHAVANSRDVASAQPKVQVVVSTPTPMPTPELTPIPAPLPPTPTPATMMPTPAPVMQLPIGGTQVVPPVQGMNELPVMGQMQYSQPVAQQPMMTPQTNPAIAAPMTMQAPPPAATPVPTPTATPLPEISVSAILADGAKGTGLCMLNGEIHHEGQTKNGITVTKITHDSVTVSVDGGEPFVVKVR